MPYLKIVSMPAGISQVLPRFFAPLTLAFPLYSKALPLLSQTSYQPAIGALLTVFYIVITIIIRKFVNKLPNNIFKLLQNFLSAARASAPRWV